MTWAVPDDVLARLDRLERRLRVIEAGPVGDSTYGVYIRSTVGLGTKHIASSTPTGGLSGDFFAGTNKLWVNDAGTWKSVTVA